MASPASASGDCSDASKRGASPMASARDRYNVASARPCDTAITGTGAAGVTTKLKTLSRASASTGAPPAVPSRTIARVFGVVIVTGANDTDAEAFGATLIRQVLHDAAVDLEVDRDVGGRRCGAIEDAGGHRDALGLPALARAQQRHRRQRQARRLARPRPTTVVIVVPPGMRSVSSGCHPPRWKSDTTITSLRGSSDSASRLPASFSAGPYFVDPGPGRARR